MVPERKDITEPSAAMQLWELTQPNNPRYAALYLEQLLQTVEIPKYKRFENPFFRPKKSGGSRKIVPTAEPLRTVHFFI